MGTIYHGTSPEAKASILENGFSQDKLKRADSVRGAYFATEKAYTRDYGPAVIEAKFNGRVGQANTDIIRGIKIFANEIKVGDFLKKLEIGEHDPFSLSRTIMDEYVTQKIANMGFQGIIGTNFSGIANCNKYFVAMDPSLIEIIH